MRNIRSIRTGFLVSTPKTVMNDVPSAPIGDFENTLSFPSEETSLGRGGFPHISLREMYHARMEPFTRFSPPHNWDT